MRLSPPRCLASRWIEVTREQRAHAKTINFGIIYGITPYGLARRIEGLDVTRAAELIADYKRRFPGIDRFLNECVQHALDHGYVTTILGRRRAIPEIRSNNRAARGLWASASRSTRWCKGAPPTSSR